MILLTFDIEEFDMPLEYGRQIPLEQQLQISAEGLKVLLPILDKHGAHATMFTTATFAEGRPELVSSMCRAGHEIASHGLYHSQFELSHLQVARQRLEQVTGMPVTGYRAPRMMKVPTEAILKAGYRYSSSINPTFLPGRYNNLDKPRRYFDDNGMVQIPASVTPRRLPDFWLSLQTFPWWCYKRLVA
ncbi:MAG: polysaccharide deacetylase family protein, partial [Rikenellaceae bacterium]|nr:polysaccharide deacetylase family protein [Rikenellaceae bacterium]